ncbi:MAG: capsule biosynthesis protein [Hydrogenophaga sp.]
MHKIHFHAGDWLFYGSGGEWFHGPLDDWPAFLADRLDRWQIDVVLLYGDCRPVHRVAQSLAQERGLDVGVFEEGYLRPHHVTLERNGVNGHSAVPRDPGHYLAQPDLRDVPVVPVGNAYWSMVWFGLCYHAVGAMGRLLNPQPVHHRPLSWLEGWAWVRSAWRKHWYAHREKAVLQRLLTGWNRRYFVVPLQVHNDTQIRVHSPYGEVGCFLSELMHSFALHAPANTALVIKHHPMDRGYRDYGAFIEGLAGRLGIGPRCFYIHDQHLPTLLDHARGAVVINSTAGLQALHHGVPLKVMGTAIYDMAGLTYQGSLDQFWTAAASSRPVPRLLRQFVRHLKHTNQINGSYYRALPGTGWRSALAWPTEHPADPPA